MEQSLSENIEKNEYENKMIEAFINNPKKTAWYQKSFKKYKVNGIEKIVWNWNWFKLAWNWNWWAFAVGPFFLFYRKAYLAGFVLLLLSTLFGVPGVIFILPILSGGFSTYFVYKEYKKKKAETERTIDDTQKRLDAMRVVGGYNKWAIWVPVAMLVVLLVSSIIVGQRTANERFGYTHKIEYSDYKQIQNGMSYTEVVSIIGVEGAEISSFSLAGNESTIYQWKNSNGSNITLTFQNNKLASKIQVGLNRR